MSKINKYELFSEWRAITLWGPTLEDAVMVHGELKRPDKFARNQGGKVEKATDGETHTIDGAKPGTVVVREYKPQGMQRGGNDYVRTVLRDVAGKYLEIDAIIRESHDCN